MNPYAAQHRYPSEIDVDESDVFSDLEVTELLVEELLGHIEDLLE